MVENHIILDTDSYKSSHFLQYPPGMEGMFSYVESRGGEYDHTVFFGLQYILKQYLSRPITLEMVSEADVFFTAHGLPFPKEGWQRIVSEFGGKLPVRIYAVPEGSVIPVKNILMAVESTDPKTFWIVSWLETLLMRMWFPVTVATRSYHIHQTILQSLIQTADDPWGEVSFKLHDFGSRGASSAESAAIGGAAHLINFMGSDTIVGVRLANSYYHSKMSGLSIPAAEHSTITAWGPDQEAKAYGRILDQFAHPGKIVAVVSDSYNLWNAIENIWGGELKKQVQESGATIVIRPDSGDPLPIVMRTLKTLESKFGHTLNTKGYKVLNHVRVIQGDGVDEAAIQNILSSVNTEGYSTTNISFGMGGALLQKVNRDTLKFAYKCSEIQKDGAHIPVFKAPITDPGKRSKAGRLQLFAKNDHYQTATWDRQDLGEPMLRCVFENGQILEETTFDDIKGRAHPEKR